MSQLTPIAVGLASIRALRGISVLYARGNDASPFTAVIGKTIYEAGDGGGTIIKSSIVDFLILTSDLILNATPITPARGDLISYVSAGKTYKYEVIDLGAEPASRASDTQANTTRIHTQLTEVI